MEFNKKVITPKSAIRHNPYGSEGKQYLRNFQKHSKYWVRSSGDITPPRSLLNSESNELGQLKSFRFSNNKPNSRGEQILQSSFRKNEGKENSADRKYTPKSENVSSYSVRRSLKINQKINLNEDPLDILSGSEDEDDDITLSSRFYGNDFNKENNATNALKPNVAAVVSQNMEKRKPLNAIRSGIFYDASPKKVYQYNEMYNNVQRKNCVFSFKSFGSKENTSQENEERNSEIESSCMIGFPNFGNTCYLNAVLQTLVSLKPFVTDVNNIIDKVNLPSHSLTYSLWALVTERQKKDCLAVRKSLRSFKMNIERIDSSFSGFKMQDANEFLTRVLDTVKDEVDKFIFTTNECICEEVMPRIPSDSSEVVRKYNSSLFDTPSPESPLSIELIRKENLSTDELDDDYFFLKTRHFNGVNLTPDKSVKSKVSLARESSATPLKGEQIPSNPVRENFEFELLDSYRCLGCGEVAGRKQKHFALYVNLPSKGKESIQQAVELYMTEDQRELTCNKCGHKKASVITRFENLPRILIVQMKRYEYRVEQLECIKVSSKVGVNLWLHLDSLMSQNAKPPPHWTPISLRMDASNGPNVGNKLSVRNLSSALNGCDVPSDANSNFVPETSIRGNPTAENVNEDEKLKEVMILSVEDAGKQNGDLEEEELQKAIKLSLQDGSMWHIHNLPVPEVEVDNSIANVGHSQLSTGECLKDKMPFMAGSRYSYRLYSIISHYGFTTCTGHYVSDVLNCEENQWLHYDDETVSHLWENLVLAEGRQKNGYIFFYIHEDIYKELATPQITH